ncbi:MAG: hypothetical protein M3301_08365 [Chloroflexota bacterium]|nr:hypothetical protein [Chloroflexota bacterium]
MPVRERLHLLRLAVAFAVLGCSAPAATSAPTAPGAAAGAGTPSATAAHSAAPSAPETAAPSERSTGATHQPPAPVQLAWRSLLAAGPAAREDHTWTVDAAGRTAYLFGGRSGGRAFDDLWRFDLERNTWQRVASSGERPQARFGHTAAWVDRLGLVVWSGQAASRFFNDLWTFDPATARWRRLPARGALPEPRYGSCAALGPDGRLWISHGFTTQGRFGDTKAYDFATATWRDETPTGGAPVVRCLHDCLWSSNGRFLLYGGQTNGVAALGDLWSYRPQERSWRQERKPEPAPRQLYALAGFAGRAFVFGGQGLGGEELADLWLLDLDGLVWTRATPAGAVPRGRAGATLIADDGRHRLLLFGGRTKEGELADLWQLGL